ncbi:MAG: tyrosine--tRNA ligase [Lachnospiraceae bacterium]|nr:tyrosine--tRNA ligase [Lachnospiraceae bacterium]
MERAVQEQLRIAKKGTLEIIREEELEQKFRRSIEEGKPLIIKLGLDPSAPDIHLGHTVVLRKVRQLQEFGHRAVIIIGDFTGKIGDPTGRSKTRKQLSEEQVRENAATYMEQIFKVLDREKTEVRFNSEWLSKLNFEEVIRLAAGTTVARLLEREDFSNRYRKQEPIGLHEFFYPLMQAYDSVHIHADIELGGTDQTFNILMGRTLQRTMGQEQQAAIFVPILEGLDGVEKMSKSLGNYIGVNEAPEVMFKKTMEIPDDLILRYFELVTDVHPDEIARLAARLTEGENPRNIKLLLAENITELYHGAEQAGKAREYFLSVFSGGQLPKDMPRISRGEKEQTLLDIVPRLIENRIVASGSEFRRMVKQGGVSMNGERVTEPGMPLARPEAVLKIGKKSFICFVWDERSKPDEG